MYHAIICLWIVHNIYSVFALRPHLTTKNMIYILYIIRTTYSVGPLNHNDFYTNHEPL